jgi:hypothetical protein
MFITIVNFIVYLFGPFGEWTLRRECEQKECRDRFPNGPFGEWTLHKKGDCHLFSTPLEKGDSPLLVIES